jgi:myo-inositol 2-dehydrogenase / D-chiro-inositol 1-dehydrogenase
MQRRSDTAHENLPRSGSGTSRREFLTTAAAIGAPLLASAQAVRGSEGNSRITLGAIGCGGRGTWIADLFQKHGGYQIAAVADYFPDRANELGDKFQIPSERRHSGLEGYRRLLQSDVDAVVIESPPYFHPRQVAEAVDAGKHVYLAKPIAVDVPGCRTVEESGRKATEKKRCFLVDFQTRTDAFYKEAVKRAQYGDIGRIVCGEATYICGPTWEQQAKWLKEKPDDPELRLRAWGLDRSLSGDVITEQNIHALDVATWVLDAAPLAAIGSGGRKARSAGTCWDHFSVIFTFPQDVLITFCSKQLGDGWDDICCRVYGTEGTFDSHYFSEVSIRGRLPYRGGKIPSLYADGAISNIATFHDSITRGDWSNPTVAPSVRSNLTTILGRTAAWRNSRVSWDEMMSANEELRADLSGLRS